MSLLSSFVRKITGLKSNAKAKNRVYTVIFGTDTPAGKRFDVILIVLITLSVLLVVCDSLVQELMSEHPWAHTAIWSLEIVMQLFFIVEYILRIYCHPRPKEYVLSFFGIVDLLSIIPLGYNAALRSFRIIRVFRVFKMLNFLNEGHELLVALRKSMNKIVVFFLFVLILNVCMGAILWAVEHKVNPELNNMLDGIYCSIVTVTTVGYGDMTPITPFGKFISSVMMLVGYTVVAIPTGIVSAEMVKEKTKKNKICPTCGKSHHKENAKFCDDCGSKLEPIQHN